ncbi:MAG: DUF1289 domain-containing protein [Xanthomonadales bacterium]|jgi:predicted Fe-S protein YdhL (DUF1289 family)|nr:DUF1289 domain-containing protein [Xanthomonadales bacterium]
MTQNLQAISTPCVGVCSADEQGMCTGCFRSCDEIASWGSLTEAQRQAIMAELDQRKDAYFA